MVGTPGLATRSRGSNPCRGPETHVSSGVLLLTAEALQAAYRYGGDTHRWLEMPTRLQAVHQHSVHTQECSTFASPLVGYVVISRIR